MSTQAQTQAAVSTRFTPDTLARIDEIAQNRQCTRSEIIKEAVNGYLNSYLWLEKAVQKGRDDIKAGRVYSQEEVEDYFKNLGVDLD